MSLRHCTGRLVLSGYRVVSVDESNHQLRIMENPADSQSQHSDNDRVADETASEQAKSQPQSEWRLLDALRDGIRRGAEDARTAAVEAIPKVKSAAAHAVYWAAYGASFAADLQWALVTVHDGPIQSSGR